MSVGMDSAREGAAEQEDAPVRVQGRRGVWIAISAIAVLAISGGVNS
jgi:hypothetical protein